MEENKITEIKEKGTGFIKKHSTGLKITGALVVGGLIGFSVAKFGPKVIGYFTAAGADAIVEAAADVAGSVV